LRQAEVHLAEDFAAQVEMPETISAEHRSMIRRDQQRLFAAQRKMAFKEIERK
jgi:hypothetical protein